MSHICGENWIYRGKDYANDALFGNPGVPFYDSWLVTVLTTFIDFQMQ